MLTCVFTSLLIAKPDANIERLVIIFLSNGSRPKVCVLNCYGQGIKKAPRF